SELRNRFFMEGKLTSLIFQKPEIGEKLVRAVPSHVLAKAFVLSPEQLRGSLSNLMPTDRSRTIFKEDLKAATRTTEESRDSAINQVFNCLKMVLFESLDSSDRRTFSEVLKVLQPEDLTYLIRRTGLVRFSKSLQDLPQ